jgi:hypothetical protein
MAVRWRDLFGYLGVQWTASSRYAGHGWIAIRCPWCGSSDPGYHLGVNEQHGHYHCLRNDQHKGRSSYWLLQKLGVRHSDMDDLLASYGSIRSAGAGRDTSEGAFPPRQSSLETQWREFEPLDDDGLQYLHDRHFRLPSATAHEFDLRRGRNHWARRIWFKLSDLDGSIIGITGRTIDGWRQPRYYNFRGQETALYMPRLPTAEHTLGLLVEGPFDALRVADATARRRNLFVAALCGLSLTGKKREQLAAIAKLIPHLAVAVDRTVSPPAAFNMVRELRLLPLVGKVRRLAMPAEIDDPGAMNNHEVEKWLSTI